MCDSYYNLFAMCVLITINYVDDKCECMVVFE